MAVEDRLAGPSEDVALADTFTATGPPPAGSSEIVADDRFELLGELGRGGMGQVFRARDRLTGQVVAIKLLPEEAASQPERLERFRRELHAARLIAHPAVVRIHDLFLLGARLALSMELVEGESLAARLARSPRLGAAEWLALAADLAAALGAAHKAGVVHRDIKPANIMLRKRTGRAVIADFGISRIGESEADAPSSGESPSAELTGTAQLLGTLPYMPPEQLEASTTIGPAADVYAIGLVLFEAATGHRPHAGRDRQALLEQRRAGIDAEALRARTDLPSRAIALVEQCLRTDPRERPVDGSALEVRLAQARPSRAWRWMLASVLGVGFLAGSAWVTSYVRARPSPERARASPLFEQGRALHQAGDVPAAATALERATTIDPTYAAAHALKAVALAELGEDARARAAADVAARLADGLPDDERLGTLARAASARHQWADAIAAYTALFRYHPADAELGLALVQAQLAADRRDDTARTLEELRKLASAASDPRLALAEARLAQLRGKYPEQRVAAERAIDLARRLGGRTLLVTALTRAGEAAREVGDPAGAHRLLEEAEKHAVTIGDVRGEAHALQQRAGVYWRQGDLQTSRALLARARALSERLGDRLGTAKALASLGLLADVEGKLGEAEDLIRRSLTIYESLGALGDITWAHMTLGSVALRGGKLTEAGAAWHRALGVARRAGDDAMICSALLNLGQVAKDQGLLVTARQHFVEAQPICHRTGDPSATAATLVHLGKLDLLQGQPDSAARLLREAHTIQAERGDAQDRADTELALAAALIERGRHDEGIALGRAAAESFRRQELHEEELFARALLAKAELEGGDTRASRRESARVLQLARLATSPDGRLQAAVLGSQLARFGAAPRVRTRDLPCELAGAERSLRLRCEVERAAASPGRAVALRRLATDAEELGYRSLAREAREMIKR